MFNSVYTSVLATVLTAICSALAGYAFAKFKFKGRNLLFGIVLATMMIPAQLGLVAFVWQMKAMNWADTHWPLIIPGIANGFGVFWMRQYIKDSVHDEMLEAAKIDGCNDIGIFLRIVLPVIKPAFVSLGIIIFMVNWQNFMIPLVLINSYEKYTLPLAIMSLKGLHRTNYGAQFLGLTLGTLPILVIFFNGNKDILYRGLTAGAVKG